MATGCGKFHVSIRRKKLPEVVYFFEPQAIEILGLYMTRGNLNWLNDPTSIISFPESVAKASFGDSDPMNQVM